MLNIRLVFLAAQFWVLSSSLSLPPFIVPCHRDDPEISKCVMDHGNAAIPHLRKGDKRLNFPALDPLIIPKATIKAGNFSIKLTNISVYGADTMRITKSKFDVKTLTAILILATDGLRFLADYEVNGKILILPISGFGPAKISFIKPVFNFTWLLGTEEVKGTTYLKTIDASVKYDVGRVTYQIDNLFNGNKELGDQMNKLMNENWRALHEEISPALSAVIVEGVRQIAEKVMSALPMDEVLL